ncbi:ABC transporter substrate-binding protein [Terrarubrum flagellatum]|uniref:ABC transporter substrate-binding protein n=1 Tax=Terrirubrum flagellatum TaxID=2895980 RepID=UPI003144ECF8
MIGKRDFIKGVATVGAMTALPRAAFAETGVAADKITFGQAAVFEGPASALGLGMRDGILAAFAEANAAAGVKGRKIELVTQDDGYEPAKSIEATKALLAQGVFALVGPVGTPTSMAALPIVKEAGAPFIGPFTGTEALRNPYQPLVVNIRASYFQETEVMVERLVKDKGAAKIAILYQDDAFGQAGLAGARRAMDKRSMKLVAEASFERNTVAVRSALLEIRKAEPEAVILIGPYKPCAEFIKLSRQIKFGPIFINISFVGSDALAHELGANGDGVLVTQVVPFPADASIPVVAAFHKALKASKPDAQPGFVSLEGYIVGRTVIAALQKIDGEPTRAALMEKLSNGSYDLGGFTLNFGPNNNQGSNAVFLTAIGADGKFKPLTAIA